MKRLRLRNFKCTFTEKKVQRPNGQVTLVTLKGHIIIPTDFLSAIPRPIMDWMFSQQRQVEIQETYLPYPSSLHFQVSGKAVRNLDDANDDKLGERLAEARAKKKLYHFCNTFLDRIWVYYRSFLNDITYWRDEYDVREENEIFHIKTLLNNV